MSNETNVTKAVSNEIINTSLNLSIDEQNKPST
jgi:hypothetical protein